MPDKSLVSDITHVALAFMSPAIFNQVDPTSWPLYTTVDETRPKFADRTAMMVAIGGWGDTAGFGIAAATKASRELFAHNIRSMVNDTGADGRPIVLKVERRSDCCPGVDIDWEYPGLVKLSMAPFLDCS